VGREVFLSDVLRSIAKCGLLLLLLPQRLLLLLLLLLLLQRLRLRQQTNKSL
jgi:hypothetical protein